MMFAALPSVETSEADAELARGEHCALEALEKAAKDASPLTALVREIILSGRVGPYEAGFMARIISRAIVGSRN